MQIVCPNCTTSYEIADTAVGENGRSVRCARCQTVWRVARQTAEAVAPTAPSTPEPAAEDNVAAFRAELGSQPTAAEPAAELPTAPPLAPSLDDLAGAQSSDTPSEPSPDSEPAPPAALADIPIPVTEPAPPAADGSAAPAGPAAEVDEGPPDVESVAARRARAAARKRQSRWRIPLSVAIVALATVSVALLGWRKDVVRHAPQLASFYSAIGMPVNLRGLTFTNVKIGNEIHDGVPVLVIEGIIVSMTATPVDVPRLRFALRNPSGAEIYSWTAQPSQPVLEPFDTMPFRSRLASPPADGHDVQVRFFTRRDAVAGVR